MHTYIAFIRGVNVGGVALKMDDLKRMLEYIRFSNVRTYIQSGNAIFESKEVNKRRMEAEIGDQLRQALDKEIVVVVLSIEELRSIASSHPLALMGEAENLYVTLLSQVPERADAEILLETMNDVDRHDISGRVVYSYYGEGYGKSKRSNNFIEKILKVSATTRNWNTMRGLLEEAEG